MKEKGLKTWIRKCKECNRDIIHLSHKYYKAALKKNTLCKSCGNSFKGKHHSEETKKAHSEKMKGNDYGKYRKITPELCEKISKSRKGIIPWNKGTVGLQPKSEETRKKLSASLKAGGKLKGDNNPAKRPDVKQKLRLAFIEQIKKLKGTYKVMYNPFACKVINAYGIKYGYNFQHAENGGEFFIKKLGYTVDGYDPINNTVIEYYEPKHRKFEKKDYIRQTEITNFLKCKFIIIREWEENDKRLISELLNESPKNV